MSKTAKRNKQVSIQPISKVARRYTSASFSLGTFSMSEGYEIVRTCVANRVDVVYNPGYHGSSFCAEVRQDSIEAGKQILEAVKADLIAEGYEVEWTANGLYGLRLSVLNLG